mmetsp:Transcript_11236/g.28448  ORF Transcript_11236/g.28448 Transcript_11236/m.28448 type:complete len:250 (-) Transcript_11236:616-1365(-)
MHTATESQICVWGFVLLTGWKISVRIEGVGVLESSIESHRYSRRYSHNIVLRNAMGLSVHGNSRVLHDLTKQHDERGAHAKCFTHAVVQQAHLLDIIQLQNIVASKFCLLLHDTLQNLGIVQEEEHSPGTGYTRGVLSRKQEGDQQTGDFFLSNERSILVFHVHEQRQDIASIRSFGIGSAFFDHLGKELYQFLACLVSPSVSCGWSFTPQGRQRCQTLVEIVIQGLQIRKHVLSDIISVQTSRGGENG